MQGYHRESGEGWFCREAVKRGKEGRKEGKGERGQERGNEK